MFGIDMQRLPLWCAIFSTGAEGHQRIREDYAIGYAVGGRALPFGMNALTALSQRNTIAADEPQLRV